MKKVKKNKTLNAWCVVCLDGFVMAQTGKRPLGALGIVAKKCKIVIS
jgi:hypothetical protein